MYGTPTQQAAQGFSGAEHPSIHYLVRSNSLCPNGIAYRTAYGIFTSGVLEKSLCSLLCGEWFRSGQEHQQPEPWVPSGIIPFD